MLQHERTRQLHIFSHYNARERQVLGLWPISFLGIAAHLAAAETHVERAKTQQHRTEKMHMTQSGVTLSSPERQARVVLRLRQGLGMAHGQTWDCLLNRGVFPRAVVVRCDIARNNWQISYGKSSFRSLRRPNEEPGSFGIVAIGESETSREIVGFFRSNH